MRNLAHAKRPLRSAVVVVLCLALAACFDMSVRLALKTDGSGAIAARIIYTREMTSLILSDRKGKPPPAFDRGGSGGNVTRTQRIEDGRLIQEETKAFKSLEEVTLGNERIEVIDLGRTFLGASRHRIVWTVRTGAKQNRDAAQSAALLFAGRTFEIGMDLPCQVESAGDADMAVMKITPTTGWSSVSWTLPLATMVSLPPNHTVTFQAECWSWAGMKPASSGSNLSPSTPAPTPTPPPVQPAPQPTPPPPVASADDIMLDQFPRLSQKDRANYADDSTLFDAWDTDANGVKRPVPALACLATVYTMIERATGNTNAKIDAFYKIGDGAIRGNLSRAEIGDQVPIDLQTIADQIRNRRPVILHGTGGPLVDHYVLVVGMSVQNATVRELIVNDPYPDAAAPDRGKLVRLAASNLRSGDVTFRAMRLVAVKSAPAEVPPPPPATPSDTPPPPPSPRDKSIGDR